MRAQHYTRQMVWNMPGETLEPAPEIKGIWRIARAIDGGAYRIVACFHDEAYARRMFTRACEASRSCALRLVDPMGAVRNQSIRPPSAPFAVERLR